jgi:hypothetical protein
MLKIEGAVAERLAALKQELSSDPGASSRRRQAARERAARDVQERAGRARAALERLQAERKSRAKTHAKDEAKKKEPKVSTTDPGARHMRFPDGAIRPAYNAQIAAAPKEGVIVSIEVTDRRNDAGLAEPMVDDIVRRYGRTPDRLLVDTSYATSEDIVALAAHIAGPVSVYTPPPNEKETVKPTTLARRVRKRAKEPRLPQGVAGAHGERSGPGRLRLTPAHRADQRRSQEPWLWFSPRSRTHQGEGSCAQACAREQSRRRSPSEDRNPMRRSPGHHPSPFATRTAFTAGERLGLEPPPNTKIRFLHTLCHGNDIGGLRLVSKARRRLPPPARRGEPASEGARTRPVRLIVGPPSRRVPSPGMAHDAIASLLAIFPRADPLKRSR